MHCTMRKTRCHNLHQKDTLLQSFSCFTVLPLRSYLAKQTKAVCAADARRVHQIFQFAKWTHECKRTVSWWEFILLRICTCTHIAPELLFTTSFALKSFKVKNNIFYQNIAAANCFHCISFTAVTLWELPMTRTSLLHKADRNVIIFSLMT